MTESLYEMIQRIQTQQREDLETVLKALASMRDGTDANFEALKHSIRDFEARLAFLEKAVFGGAK